MMRTTLEPKKGLAGMAGFATVRSDQVISLLGTGMTWFAIIVWARGLTAQAAALALVAFFSSGPLVLLTPVTGALVGRRDHRLVARAPATAVAAGQERGS